MDFDFRKPLFILALFVGLCAYVNTHYTPQDALKFARKNPQMSIAPAIDYYIGLGYYTRSEYPKAVDAFNQLLTDYATTQYTADSLFRLGVAHDEMFHWQEAKDAYDQYMTRFPDGPDLSLVQRRYEQIKFK